jgi:hypothetical protein
VRARAAAATEELELASTDELDADSLLGGDAWADAGAIETTPRAATANDAASRRRIMAVASEGIDGS